MRKDFDGWNEKKKATNDHAHAPLYHERDIRWCHLGTNVGFEQDGTGEGYSRPVLVLKGFSRTVCLVLPLTTSAKRNPFHISIGALEGREAAVIISQIRLIDTKRLYKKIGTVDSATFRNIRKAVKDLL